MTVPLSATVRQHLASFSGTVLFPGDANYDDIRRVQNGLIDKRPAVIARCKNTADVVVAVQAARQTGLEISIRGGGHNVAGRAVTEGGLMIELSLMNGVTVDPAARTAVAEGGATWAEFNRATQAHGLATTGGVVSSTGVGGLTLGGGLGWLMGVHGLAIDNLLAVEVVLADGRVAQASAQSEPELFWGLRGGGGNFGVATRFTFRLHPQGIVAAGMVAHPLERGEEVLRFYRSQADGAPEALTRMAGLMHAPDGSGHKLAAIAGCHAGGEAGMADVAAVKLWGPPVVDMLGPIPYEAANSMLDAAFPKGALNYWKSCFLSTLSDAAIDVIVGAFRACPAPLGFMLLERFHGAVSRVAPTATAFPHRAVGYNLLILSQWMDPQHSDACIAWARNTFQAVSPFSGGGRYVNYLGDDEAGAAVDAAFGVNTARLRAVKAMYDPQNVFYMNQNIVPKG